MNEKQEKSNICFEIQDMYETYVFFSLKETLIADVLMFDVFQLKKKIKKSQTFSLFGTASIVKSSHFYFVIK